MSLALGHYNITRILYVSELVPNLTGKNLLRMGLGLALLQNMGTSQLMEPLISIINSILNLPYYKILILSL